jgi:hypothetical protein
LTAKAVTLPPLRQGNSKCVLAKPGYVFFYRREIEAVSLRSKAARAHWTPRKRHSIIFLAKPRPDSVPTDSGAFLQARPNTALQFCGLEIVNAVLTVAGVAFEKAGAHRVTLRADPARARHGPSGGIGSRCKRSRTAFASQSRCVLVSL